VEDGEFENQLHFLMEQRFLSANWSGREISLSTILIGEIQTAATRLLISNPGSPWRFKEKILKGYGYYEL